MRAHTRIDKADHDRVVEAGKWQGLTTYLALLRAHSDSRPEDKDCFPAGAGRLARLAGTSVATVKRAIPILRKLGLIEVVSGRRADRNGDHEPNRYRLLDTAPEEALGRVSQNLPRRVSQNLRSGLTDPRIKDLKRSLNKKGPRHPRRGATADAAPAGEAEEEDFSWDPLP